MRFVYLTLANKLIHAYNPGATTIAEEMSGLPGLAASVDSGGIGFDYRLAMGVPDIWIKMVKEIPDENWDLGYLLHELTQHRPEERVVSYCESHDQALVGDKTLIFRLADAEMYTSMSITTPSLIIDRAIALHKMIRLFTFLGAGGGYLTFMGNEFGHPEWIDFPREGNNWSYKYARRQWSLADNSLLRYRHLDEFDRAMIETGKKHDLPQVQMTEIITVNNADKIIAFKRGELLTVMNFNPTVSFTGYGIPIKGKFRIVLSTDDPSVWRTGTHRHFADLFLSAGSGPLRRNGTPPSQTLHSRPYCNGIALRTGKRHQRPLDQSTHRSRQKSCLCGSSLCFA